MRTSIEIGNEPIKEAQQLSNLKTKRAVLEAALRISVRVQRQKAVLQLAGKGKWELTWTRCARVASLMTLVDSSVWIGPGI